MATETSPPSCKVVLVQNIAKGLLAEVQERLYELQEKPFLVGFMANEDPAAQMYADWCRKTAKEK
jgi:methylenetetrahydrofolate dehydrogenase (NAD+)